MAMLTIRNKEEVERFYRAYVDRSRINGSQDTGKGVLHFDGHVQSVTRWGEDNSAYWIVTITDQLNPSETRFYISVPLPNHHSR